MQHCHLAEQTYSSSTILAGGKNPNHVEGDVLFIFFSVHTRDRSFGMSHFMVLVPRFFDETEQHILQPASTARCSGGILFHYHPTFHSLYLPVSLVHLTVAGQPRIMHAPGVLLVLTLLAPLGALGLRSPRTPLDPRASCSTGGGSGVIRRSAEAKQASAGIDRASILSHERLGYTIPPSGEPVLSRTNTFRRSTEAAPTKQGPLGSKFKANLVPKGWPSMFEHAQR